MIRRTLSTRYLVCLTHTAITVGKGSRFRPRYQFEQNSNRGNVSHCFTAKERHNDYSSNARSVCRVAIALGVGALCIGTTDTNRQKWFQAARYGDVQEIKSLVKAGFDVNEKHPLGWTALQVAAVNGHNRLVKFLLESGADINMGDDFMNVWQTSQEKKMNSLHVLITREDLFSDNMNNRANFQGCTALHYAVLVDDLTMAKLLLENGGINSLKFEHF